MASSGREINFAGKLLCMKQVVTAFLLLAGSCTMAQDGADWKDMGLKGKVKTLKNQWTYRYKADGVNFTPWEKQQATVYEFSNTGRYTSIRETKPDGSQNYRVQYSYKPAEKKGEQSFFGKDDQPTIRKTMTYDDKGRLKELIEYTKEGKKDRWYVYEYDVRGNNTTRSYFRTDGSLGSKSTWTYDVNGFKIGYKLETTGYATSYEKYVVDSKGNRVQETSFDQDYRQRARIVREYDANGNKISESRYDEEDQLRVKATWKYEYDKQGNWTKRTEFTGDGVDFNVDERTIIYY